MFILGGVGQFTRAWTLPHPLNLNGGSPVFGAPSLVSVVPGAYSSVVPGTVNFTVPNYTALSITLRGAGGGGSSDVISGAAAGNGETSSFLLSGGSLPPGLLMAEGKTLGTSMLASGGLAGVGPVPADQGGSGGTVTVGGGGAGGLGFIGSSPGGSASYSDPADYDFVVPLYTTLTADVRGAGGGYSLGGTVAGAGGYSVFGPTTPRVQAEGGGGAGAGVGVDGGGFGGTVTVGGGGAGATSEGATSGGAGGKVVGSFTAGGLAVGSHIVIHLGAAGTNGVPGGGGDSGGDGGGDGFRAAKTTTSAENGSAFITWTYTAPHPASYYSGSAGGRVTKNWLRTDVGAPPPGTVIGIYIGNGGTPAMTPNGPAQAGAPGRIDITWS